MASFLGVVLFLLKRRRPRGAPSRPVRVRTPLCSCQRGVGPRKGFFCSCSKYKSVSVLPSSALLRSLGRINLSPVGLRAGKLAQFMNL